MTTAGRKRKETQQLINFIIPKQSNIIYYTYATQSLKKKPWKIIIILQYKTQINLIN